MFYRFPVVHLQGGRGEIMITSLTNPKVKQAVKLRERRARDKTELFLIEGYRELLRAVDGGATINVLFTCEERFLGTNEDLLIQRCKEKGALVLPCSISVFDKISYRDRPDGLLAIAPQRHRSLEDLDEILKGNDKPFLIVAESIEKPGNLGTILRSADGTGADGVIVCDRCTDVHNPNVVRASVGTLFTIPVVETSSQQALRWLKERGVKSLAATPSADKCYTDVDLNCGVAIVVGTEQYGLSKLWMEQADYQVRIPMKGVADSLNVAMATTLLLYEVLRQRS